MSVFNLERLPASRRHLVAELPRPRKDGPYTIDTCGLRPERQVRLDAIEIRDPTGTLPPGVKTAYAEREIRLPAVTVSYCAGLRVSGHGMMVTPDDHVLEESNVRPQHAKWLDADTCEIDHATTPVAAARYEVPVVVMTRVWPPHYGHWLYDNLAVLTFVREALGGLDDLHFVVGYADRGGDWLRPGTAQRSSLELLGIPRERIIAIGAEEWAYFDHAYVPSPVNNFRPPADSIHSQPEIFAFLGGLRDAITETERAGAGPLVYVSRMDSNRRVCENEDVLSRELAERGFVTVIPGELTFPQQIGLFASADVVVGPIGNAFMNMAFCLPGKHMIVPFPRSTHTFLAYYQNFITHIGLRMTAIAASRESAFQPGRLGDVRWTADVEQVLQCVDRVLGASPHS